jgi:GH15 family glucan-1,4-alpha-glucosidase
VPLSQAKGNHSELDLTLRVRGSRCTSFQRQPGQRSRHSLCLLALLAQRRALRIAGSHRTSSRRRQRWAVERDALATEIATDGFGTARASYSRTYGSSDVDAALLVLPLLEIEPADSFRVRGTIDTIRSDLTAGGPLLYRYRPGHDGLPGSEGAFVPCSFWLAQALARSGRLEEATKLFDALVALCSPLGLYAEEIDPVSHHHLGNFPQALSHAALVQAALALRDAHTSRESTPRIVDGDVG